jgi:hypothetical protein
MNSYFALRYATPFTGPALICGRGGGDDRASVGGSAVLAWIACRRVGVREKSRMPVVCSFSLCSNGREKPGQSIPAA